MSQARCLFFVVITFVLTSPIVFAQNAGTGAIAGVITDSTGAVIPDATIRITNQETRDSRVLHSTSKGNFSANLLLPGAYMLEVSKTGYKDAKYTDVKVHVTETEALNVTLGVGSASETVEVSAGAQVLQTETSSLGNVTSEEQIESLPLVTRNYTQIIGLSSGVSTDVTNAGDIGRGNGGYVLSEGAISVGGATVMDNTFQMNGANVNDLEQSSFNSAGWPIPNPDTIAEFKVQTAAYDASYGRAGGANVNVVTKGGTNTFHGALFEFFRNNALNANDYFLKQNKQPRPILRQNQFGFTVGGPILQNKLTFFTSYQGTRQANGVSGQCSTTFVEPALTNSNRTPAGLGSLLAGAPTFYQQQTGTATGETVAPDGSNISPQALALLTFKLANGQYLIPSAQSVNAALASDPATAAIAGSSSISAPCPFNEDQYMANLDWSQSLKSKWQERFFFVNSNETLTMNNPFLGGSAIPGVPTNVPQQFRNVSLSNEYLISPRLLNQVVIGYNRVFGSIQQTDVFSWPQVGVTIPPIDASVPPVLTILGSIGVGGNGQIVPIGQNQYTLQDNIAWSFGKQTLRIGAGAERDDLDYPKFVEPAGMQFGSWPDFLLGLPGGAIASGGNGTPNSNVLFSLDQPGILSRNFRSWDVNAYGQDDIKLTNRLTVNLGLRFERLGDLGERNGRNSNFDINLANPNPPAAGTLQGFVVASNYPGVPPAGVVRNGAGTLAINGQGQNTINPRVGLAWRLPRSDRYVFRAGWGLFHQKPTGQAIIPLLFDAPWATSRGLSQPSLSLASPFAGNITFPTFAGAQYSPNTQLAPTAFAPNFRPPSIQHYSANIQTELGHDLLLEVGYIGSRTTHLETVILPDQAGLASPAKPIRNVTTNTVANIAQRTPLEGFSPAFFGEFASIGEGWYNAGEASLSKRFRHGLQFIAAYTWSRDLLTETNSINQTNGTRVGNQFDVHHDYGPDQFVRPHRFVLSGVYETPKAENWNHLLQDVVNGWQFAGVVTVQSGDLLTVTDANVNNVFGINSFGGDFAELTPGCSLSQVNNPGSVTSKLNRYINAGCFTHQYPIIGSDGIGTAFGNTRPGIVHGPAQQNVDLALIRHIGVKWPNESANVEFRAEAFNSFNTPQFGNPDTNFSDSTFGQIHRTVVSPRIVQFALKVNF